jgi:hypothetical protein
VGIIVIYILSPGPVIGLIERGYISSDRALAVVTKVYAPLDLLDRWPPSQAVLEWYVDLWMPSHKSRFSK